MTTSTSRSAASALPRRRFLHRLLFSLVGAAIFGRAKRAEARTQSTEPFLGEIQLFAGTFAPRGWALCNGQLLPIAQNQALFAILGTNYGGNGQTTFALPDLRGRVAIHQGQGPGLSMRTVGQVVGAPAHTLTVAEMPSHRHAVNASSAAGTITNPNGAYMARNPAQIPQYAPSADTTLATGAIGTVGGGQPHSNHQPVLALHYIIALQGVFPSQQ